MTIFIYPLVCFALCAVLVPLVRKAALARGWMAQPKKDRWHKKPTALMGGIAIFGSAAICLWPLADFSTLVQRIGFSATQAAMPPLTATALLGGLLLFGLGLLDDLITLRPQTKLVGQIFAASLVTFLGFRLQWFESLTLDTFFTIVWVVGITNAFNLLDNMDGLCAGVGAVAGFALAALLYPSCPASATAALVVSGALAAFLIYNFNPASIFMGDCGSLPVGFMLSVISLGCAKTAPQNPMAAMAVPVLVMMVPIFDTTMVTVIRVLSGRKASTGGRDHTSHRLVLMGLSERQAVLFLYAISAFSGLSALFVSKSDTLTSPAAIIPVGVSFLLMGIYLAQLRVYPEKEFSLLRDHGYTPVLMELTYKRQLLLVLLDFFLVAFAYYLSYRLRFDSKDFSFYFKVFLDSLPAVIACKSAAFYFMGGYRGFWRYISSSDVLAWIKASTVASGVSVAAVTYIYRFEDFSKGIFIIDWFLTTGFLLGVRWSFRLFLETIQRKTMAGQAVLIYGAGRGGEILLRELLNNEGHCLKPVGFIDDDPLKTGKKLQGYPVLGTLGGLDGLLERHPVSGILVSFVADPAGRLETLKTYCKKNGLFIKKFSVELTDIPL